MKVLIKRFPFQKHENSCKNNDADACPFCQLILPSSDEISIHIKKEHNGCTESQRISSNFQINIHLIKY